MVLCWSTLCMEMAGAATTLNFDAPHDSLCTAEVWATRRLTGISTAVAVQRIDSVRLQAMGVTDIGDALRRMAGVNLRDYGGAGGLKTVSVRGLGASHTAVAYDGLCLSDVRQGQTDLQRYSIDRVASIELQTLDNASLLCPVRNLAAAVVYLQSIVPQTTNKALHGNFSLNQASFGTWNPSLYLEKSVAKHTYLSMGGEWFRAHNDYPFTVANGVATQRLRRTNSRMQSGTGEISFTQLLASGRIDGKAYFYHNARYLPGQVVLYVNDNNEHLTEENAFAQVKWSAEYGKWQLFVAGKHNWQKSLYDNIDSQYPEGALRQHYWQRETYSTAGVSYQINTSLRAAYATDYAHASLNSNLVSDNHASRDLWLQSLSFQYITARLNVTARGVVHLYWNSLRGGGSAHNAQRITPSLTASYLALRAPLWLYIRLGYKESFRLPTFTESYYYHLGNATLKPELAHQLSAGFTLQATIAKWWPVVALTTDAYLNKIDDRIVSIPYNLFVWHTENLKEVRTRGLDLTLESQWQPAKNHLIITSANLSLQNAEDRTQSSSASYKKQLAYTPHISGGASLAWNNPWLSVVAHTTFSGHRWCSASHVVGTRLSAYQEWGFGAWRTLYLRKKQHIDLRADIINAFDRQYEIVARYPMPGRSYKVSVKYIF